MKAIVRFFIKVLRALMGEETLLHYTASGFNKTIIGLKNYGYLYDVGWIESFQKMRAVGKNGDPIPWLSYPIIEFLETRALSNLYVFEYGGGNSTLYFSGRVKEIHTVESDQAWFENLKKNSPPNAHVYFEPVDSGADGYTHKPGMLQRKFDIVIVDGVYRKDCLRICKEYLSDKGIVIVDDTNVYDYGNEISDLTKMGYKRIDFSGMSSFVIGKKTSTILYRERNCLDI